MIDPSESIKKLPPQETELLLLPDGRVLAHALTPEASVLLRELSIIPPAENKQSQDSKIPCQPTTYPRALPRKSKP